MRPFWECSYPLLDTQGVPPPRRRSPSDRTLGRISAAVFPLPLGASRSLGCESSCWLVLLGPEDRGFSSSDLGNRCSSDEIGAFRQFADPISSVHIGVNSLCLRFARKRYARQFNPIRNTRNVIAKPNFLGTVAKSLYIVAQRQQDARVVGTDGICESEHQFSLREFETCERAADLWFCVLGHLVSSPASGPALISF